MPRLIVHVSLDVFYASVKLREQHGFAEQPVTSFVPGRRGIGSTAKNFARNFRSYSVPRFGEDLVAVLAGHATDPRHLLPAHWRAAGPWMFLI